MMEEMRRRSKEEIVDYFRNSLKQGDRVIHLKFEIGKPLEEVYNVIVE